MKRLMAFAIGLAMVFTASVSPSASSVPRDTVPDAIQLSPGGEIGKKDATKPKMTKKTKRESAAEAETKAVVK